MLTSEVVSAKISLALNEAHEIWGYSSAGRALEWHSRGQRFDPAYLHQTEDESPRFFLLQVHINRCPLVDSLKGQRRQEASQYMLHLHRHEVR